MNSIDQILTEYSEGAVTAMTAACLLLQHLDKSNIEQILPTLPVIILDRLYEHSRCETGKQIVEINLPFGFKCKDLPSLRDWFDSQNYSHYTELTDTE